MAKAVIILTCFNRKDKTTKCIKSIMEGNKNVDLKWVVVDDKSTDGTVEAIREIVPEAHIITGTGKLFWNGGMNRGMEYAKKNLADADCFVMINDDVEFVEGIFDEMSERLEAENVLVGATKSTKGKLSYGGIKYNGGKSLKLRMVGPDENSLECDTFNANCVFIPRKIFLQAGATDPNYSHSMGDFDYGFRIRKLGYKIFVYEKFVGVCNDNPIEGTWQDRKLSVFERLKLKEGIKGLPFKDWFRYLKKNFGLDVAIVRSVTPYIKIILGR